MVGEKKTQNSEISNKNCSVIEKLTQNLRAPKKNKAYIKNGRFDSYTGTVVREAHILQKYLNALGFSAGKVDGIIGPKSRSAIFRLQKFLGTKQDGYVGPKTRKFLNSSNYCKK